MKEYGCHVTLGLSLLTHNLAHEAIREIFIAALELREKRTVRQIKGQRTTQNRIEEVQEEEPEPEPEPEEEEPDPQKEEPKRKKIRWNKLRNRPKRRRH
ncbi:unnamed protein product [Prunus armeniaca]|uniref:Uncharacterized protein n=1 Tax=Prunus armeniaca TaxID=36596 RepID=A0A6J5XGS6_PRUAR|nr:unnamed protein product [Prunus armeniaca]CAB4311145.1 unnamed protein product [Prunus armeniaca]